MREHALWLVESLERRRLLSSITTTQAIDYVHQVWDITDTTVDAITQTLDLPYDGATYRDFMGGFVNGVTMIDQLGNGKFHDAAVTGLNYGLTLASNSALESVGLLGVASVAQLAAWPIEHELQSIAQTANSAALQTEAELYFHARMGGTQAQDIIDAANAHSVSLPFDADGGWTVYMEGQGWLQGQRPTGTVISSTPLYGITPLQFYAYVEKQFLVRKAQDELKDDSEQVKESFYAVLHPGAAAFTLQPKDQNIAGGSTAALTVQASGAGTVQYQWLNGSGLPIAGQRVAT